MNLLLDTQIFLWLIDEDPRLPASWAEAIADVSNSVLVSVASIWEAAIKHRLGKLPLPSPVVQYLAEQRDRHSITSLAIDEGSVARLANLPSIHKDPFDRILSARRSSTASRSRLSMPRCELTPSQR